MCSRKKSKGKLELSGISLSLLTSDHDDLQIGMPAASVSPPKSCANFLVANSDPEPNREGDCGKFNFSLVKLIHYKSTKVNLTRQKILGNVAPD